MATEYIADDGGLDDFDWDAKAAHLHFGGLAAKTTGAKPRSGVVPANGDPLSVVLKVGRTLTVRAGVYVMANPSAPLGAYEIVVPFDVDLDLDTASAQTRVDVVVVEVQDTGTSTSRKRLGIVKGTPGLGRPALPAPVGNGSIEALADATLNANATVVSGIVDRRQFTAAAGGALRVPGALANNALAASLPPGTPVWDEPARAILWRDGAAGLLRERPYGSGIDLSWFLGQASNVVVGLNDVIMYDALPLLHAPSSENPSCYATGKDINLPGDGVFDIQVVIACADPTGFGGQFKLVRSTDNYPLGALNVGNGTLDVASFTVPGVRGSEFSRITVKGKNVSTGPRTFSVTVWINRVRTRLV